MRDGCKQCYLWIVEAIHFLQQFRAVSKIHILLIHVRLLYMTDDRFDNFSLMAADKIRVRSTDKGFVVQSNDEAIKRCLYGVLWSFGVQQKLGNLSDRLSSLNPRDFIRKIFGP